MINFESRLFSTQEIAKLLNCNVSTVQRIAKDRNIVRVFKKNGNTRTAYFSYASYRLIESVLQKHRTKKLGEPKVTVIEKAEEHPLVTDKRLLNLYYFPDVIPDCFKTED